MKVKILSSGKVVGGKYYKDLPDKLLDVLKWDDMDMFVDLREISDAPEEWEHWDTPIYYYMHESEIEIIEED